MLQERRTEQEIDFLIEEMERVDEALAIHLDGISRGAVRRGGRGPGWLHSLEDARREIEAWCESAADDGRFDFEVLATTAVAAAGMEPRELAAFIRGLLARRSQRTATTPAA